MPEFYIIIARKIFSRILGGTCPPCLPVSYAYEVQARREGGKGGKFSRAPLWLSTGLMKWPGWKIHECMQMMRSCIFQPCDLVRHFLIVQIHRPIGPMINNATAGTYTDTSECSSD